VLVAGEFFGIAAAYTMKDDRFTISNEPVSFNRNLGSCCWLNADKKTISAEMKIKPVFMIMYLYFNLHDFSIT
jgi:hypothetical protein